MELLRQVLDLIGQEGYRQVSLSVQKANYALRMYQKAGFETVANRGEEILMVCRLIEEADYPSRYKTLLEKSIRFISAAPTWEKRSNA